MEDFFDIMKAFLFVAIAPFVLVFKLFAYVFGVVEHNRVMKESGERIRAMEQETAARLAAPFKSNTAATEAATQDLIKAADFPDMEKYADALVDRIAADAADRGLSVPAPDVRAAIVTALLDLYGDEHLGEPILPRVVSGAIEEGRYRDELVAMGRKAEDPARTLMAITRALSDLFFAVQRHLPPFAHERLSLEDAEQHHVATVPLLDAIADPAGLVNELTVPFFREELIDLQLFKPTRTQLARNGDAAGKPGKVVMPEEYEGNPRELVRAYLRNTPLAAIFEARVPFDIPLSRRLEHTAIVAGTGWGKTQLLQNMIAHDLEEPDPPALVVVDSTGAMIRRIQRLAVFDERLADRILIIDPEQDPVPALNMFDVSNPRLQTYGRAVREEVETEIIGLFNYIFGTLAAEMTGRQSTAFSYVVRLILSIPGATIHTLRELLEDDGNAFAPYIAKLDPTAQAFFQNHFYFRGFRATRAQIAQRLYALIQVPAFERMFSTVNRVDMFAELQRGSIILINTSTRLLKEDASPLFGRYMIARTLAAIFERAALPEDQRRPAFLIIDEAAPYFDDTFDAMLTRVRQFKLGVVIAFQHLEQASERLRSAIASNTAIKYAGGVGYTDSRWLSREMRTSPEFIQGQRRDSREPPRFTQFACYVRNFTDTAVSLTVPIGTLENLPRMSEETHRQLLARNRDRVSAPAQHPAAKPAEQTGAATTDNDVAPEPQPVAIPRKAANASHTPTPAGRAKPPDRDPGPGTEGATDRR